MESQTSSAEHQRPGSSSSTSSRRTSQSSKRSSGTTSRSRGTTTGSPLARWRRRSSVVPIVPTATSCGPVGDPRITRRQGTEHGARGGRRWRAAGHARTPAADGEAMPGHRVDERGVDVGDRRRVGRAGQQDRAASMPPAPPAPRRSWARGPGASEQRARRARVAAWASGSRRGPSRSARRATAVSQASGSLRSARVSERSHGPVASLSSRIEAASMVRPSGSGMSNEAKRPECAANAHRARSSHARGIVWCPSQPHRCTVRPARWRAAWRPPAAPAARSGRRLGTARTLPSGCQRRPELAWPTSVDFGAEAGPTCSARRSSSAMGGFRGRVPAPLELHC